MDKIISNISSLEINSEIAVLTIENGKKNLLTEPEFIDINVLDDALNHNPQVTTLIITGAGRHFSHGADTSLFSEANNTDLISTKLKKARELLNYIENLSLITAAAINGGCFGGGFEIALSCQFRICSKNAFLGLPEIMHGVIPGMGGIERLTKIVGKSKAISMILSGEMIPSVDAFKIGLVDLISENKNCFSDAVNFTEELSDGKSSVQINSIISTINRSLDFVSDPSDGEFERVLQALTENNQ